MICDRIENTEQYRGNHPLLNKALALAADLETMDLRAGRNEIDGDDLFIMNFSYQTIAEEEGCYETHRNYADIQILRKGREFIRALPYGYPEAMGPYDKAGDCRLYALNPGCDILLEPGVFALFLPGELHAPKLRTGGSEKVDKIVIKVRMDSLS